MSAHLNPSSLDQALRWLADDPSLVPVAGCTDLMVASLEERAEMSAVIDLLGIPELHGVREREGWLEIGATTTFSEIRRAPVVRERYSALREAAAVIGGWQIQNRGTIGGNIANASPAGDSLPVLLALDAQVSLVGIGGERQVPYREFHTGYRETVLQPGEIIGWIRLPSPPPGSRQMFRKVGTRRAQAISKVVVALVGRVEAGRVTDYRLAAGSVAPYPLRLGAVEERLVGAAWNGDLAAEAGRLAAASVQPIDDVRSTAAYRRFALAAVVERMTARLVVAESA